MPTGPDTWPGAAEPELEAFRAELRIREATYRVDIAAPAEITGAPAHRDVERGHPPH